MEWQERIVTDPEVLTGKPAIKGTRISVEFIMDLLAQGWTEADLLRNYPALEQEDIQACLFYVRDMLPRERNLP
jgi:uncharacterized protein (DUF433 family)